VRIPVNALNNPILIDLCPGAYHAYAFSEGFREGVEDIHRRVQPLGQPFIAILRSIKVFGLLLKHQEDAAGRVAGLKLRSERVGKKIRFCASLIYFQGIIEKLLEVRGRCGGCGSRVRMRLRHNSGSEEDDTVMGSWETGIEGTSPRISAHIATKTWGTASLQPNAQRREIKDAFIKK
jgi:hypothetical protein